MHNLKEFEIERHGVLDTFEPRPTWSTQESDCEKHITTGVDLDSSVMSVAANHPLSTTEITSVLLGRDQSLDLPIRPQRSATS
jgi:hypothetical protein